jgi:hypothetical protein
LGPALATTGVGPYKKTCFFCFFYTLVFFTYKTKKTKKTTGWHCTKSVCKCSLISLHYRRPSMPQCHYDRHSRHQVHPPPTKTTIDIDDRT